MDIHSEQLVRPISAMESLEQQLSCPICLDMFNKPVVILPCQHNLCRGCANDLFESRNPYHYSGGTFRCPSCRFQVVLDRHGVYGLQRNLLVENIIDVYKQQQESRGVGVGVGDGEDPPLKDKDDKEPKCREHEDERINIYCVSCQTPTCSMCKVFGQHKDCEVSPLLAVYESQKEELRSAVELLAVGSGCLQAAVAQMDDACRLIRENAEQKKRRLGESFDLLFALLEERKGLLLQRVGRAEQQTLTELGERLEQQRQQLLLSGQLQDKLTHNLDSCSMVDFLLTTRQLQEQARGAAAAAAAPAQRRRPDGESLERLKLDTREVEAVLLGLDFRPEEADGDAE